jgi:GT2 family glycosyltransferase
VGDVVAVVLTHRRPRLATATVRWLIADQGFAPADVLVVVNGDGGIDPGPDLEAVQVMRLEANLGPSGGFDRGLERAFADPDVRWAYACEDDVSLIEIPPGRVRRTIEDIDRFEAQDPSRRVGAVVSYGRRFQGRAGETRPYIPTDSPALQPVDVAAWGATLISRRVAAAGVHPDHDLFFGYEDFDYYLRMRAAGFVLLVDAETGRAVAHQMTLAGRDASQAGQRPVDSEEAWREFYIARNFVSYARRHGNWRWQARHLMLSVRRAQLAHSWAARRATAHGLLLGARGRLGLDPRYVRTIGEWPER